MEVIELHPAESQQADVWRLAKEVAATLDELPAVLIGGLMVQLLVSGLELHTLERRTPRSVEAIPGPPTSYATPRSFKIHRRPSEPCRSGGAALPALNYARPPFSLGKNVTPAMAGGVANPVWACEGIAVLLD